MGASTTKHFKSRIEKLNNFAETIPTFRIHGKDCRGWDKIKTNN